MNNISRQTILRAVAWSATVVLLGGTARAEQDDVQRRFQVDGRVGGGFGPNSLGFLGQIDAGYDVIPSLLVGAYLQSTLGRWTAQSSDGCDFNNCALERYVGMGVRSELHTSPERVFRAWGGLGVGGGFPTGARMNPFVADVSFDVGVDVGSQQIALGPYLGVRGFLSNLYSGGGSGAVISLGVRLAARF